MLADDATLDLSGDLPPTTWATRAGVAGLVAAFLLAGAGVINVQEFAGATGGVRGVSSDVAWITLGLSAALGACSAGTMAKVGACAIAQAVLFGLLGLMMLVSIPSALLAPPLVAVAVTAGLAYPQIRARAKHMAELTAV